MSLTPELARARDEIRRYAIEAGLDFFEVLFEVLDWNQMNAVASYGGFPNRYPHWRFGMEYEQIHKSYAYGLSKIYEMVINNDPSYAYLLHSNNIVDQKMVMAHVYGHSDFFKNNVYFSSTNRKMIDEMGNHRSKVMSMVNRHGVEEVEDFIDGLLSLENLIDIRQVGMATKRPPLERVEDEDQEEVLEIKRLPSKDYMDRYVNPQAFIDKQKQQFVDDKKKKQFPESPERDVLYFLGEHAPLERWQRDLLWMIREEAYYFAPQGMTKIMNEGWAAYHHSKIMTTKVLKDSEIIDYADHHSGTVSPQPGRLNPYKIGMELFRHIEDCWNRGKFGVEYENCQDMKEKASWDKKLGLGRVKIFEVRKIYNDVTFLDEFLDEEFCNQQKFFHYAFNPSTGAYEIVDRDVKKVKAKLLQSLTNMGQPQVAVIDANTSNRGELTLKHFHDGVDLRQDWVTETLRNLHRLWKRPVHVETLVEGMPKVLSYDGTSQKEEKVS
ncbi:MAG: SpoVR family protein [Deltaproteobacteria bacterium]|nr:SpoVR family protein [Deltaproteobacteria bacterium]